MSKTNPINSIICGDCRDRMKDHIDDESIDLIYLDPPFFSGKDYDLIWKTDKTGDKNSKATIESFSDSEFYKKVCGKCGAEWKKKPNDDYYARCASHKCDGLLKDAKFVRRGDIDVYVGWLEERLEECYRVLKHTGSIYLHVDWHAVHYMKVVMDEIFGRKNFQSEIIWKRKNQSRNGSYGHNHDTILYYTKSSNPTFNTQTVTKIIDNPATYHNKPCKTAPASGYSDARQKQMLSDGSAYITKNGKIRQVTYLDKDKYGNVIDTVPCDNIWLDIPNMMHTPKSERLGYPTQKPETLLERIIKVSSNKGDIVLDPFCGCGTTITVANRLNREWIGIDIEPLSCTVQQVRMEKTFGKEFPIIDLGKRLAEERIDEEEAYRIMGIADELRPLEFQTWVVEVLKGKPNVPGPDDGIDGWIVEPFGNCIKDDIIQVKKMDKVSRDVVKLHAYNTIANGRKSGLVVGYGFTRGAVKEADIIRARDGIDIELLTIKSMLLQTGKNIKSPGKQSTGTQTMLSDTPKKQKTTLKGSKLTDKQQEHLKDFGYVNMTRNGKEHRITPSRVMRGVIK